MILQHLVTKFLLYNLSSGHLQEDKNKENFTLLALKVVMNVYERWSLTRFGFRFFIVLHYLQKL